MYSPRMLERCGLTDGEAMERLWSYLRKFARSTKEMRPSHRIDVITSALIHYATKTRLKLGIIVCYDIFDLCMLYLHIIVNKLCCIHSCRSHIVCKVETCKGNRAK